MRKCFVVQKVSYNTTRRLRARSSGGGAQGPSWGQRTDKKMVRIIQLSKDFSEKVEK